jgi:hypothetical protein
MTAEEEAVEKFVGFDEDEVFAEAHFGLTWVDYRLAAFEKPRE